MLVVVAGLAAVVVMWLVYAYDPEAAGTHFPSCPFHALTGLNCPGCGATRALYHLLHGDVSGAFRFNQIFFLMVPFFAAAARWPRILTKPSVAWTIAVVMITYGIVRNLPFWPYPL